jgi:hypothetical protein
MTDKLTASATPQIEQAAQAFTQWTILNVDATTTDVKPGTRYLLKNSRNRHFLYYKNQGSFGGINLGFSDNAEPSTAKKVVHWEFVNRNRTPVKYGEPVALRCKDSYLHYGKRDVGINLKWSDSPVHQWWLYGGRPGTPVKTRDWVCIWNMHGEYGEPLIYFQRTIGGNIGWPSSKTLLEQGLDWAKEAVQKAVVEYFKSQAGGK